MPQQGIVYRYFRVDADHDVSGDPLALSTDGGTTWITSGITYITPVSWPPSVIAANTTSPVPAGLVGYWWRVLTGPGQTLPLEFGPTAITGRLTDSPETPRLAWSVFVRTTE